MIDHDNYNVNKHSNGSNTQRFIGNQHVQGSPKSDVTDGMEYSTICNRMYNIFYSRVKESIESEYECAKFLELYHNTRNDADVSSYS